MEKNNVMEVLTSKRIIHAMFMVFLTLIGIISAPMHSIIASAAATTECHLMNSDNNCLYSAASIEEMQNTVIETLSWSAFTPGEYKIHYENSVYTFAVCDIDCAYTVTEEGIEMEKIIPNGLQNAYWESEALFNFGLYEMEPVADEDELEIMTVAESEDYSEYYIVSEMDTIVNTFFSTRSTLEFSLVLVDELDDGEYRLFCQDSLVGILTVENGLYLLNTEIETIENEQQTESSASEDIIIRLDYNRDGVISIQDLIIAKRAGLDVTEIMDYLIATDNLTSYDVTPHLNVVIPKSAMILSY